jgi:ribosomal protein S4
MISIKKKFLLCRKYEKDIWGDVTTRHKTINLGWIKARPNVANVPHLIKNKWLLQDFHKWLLIKNVWLLTFSFEIVRRMKKKWPKKMKNWMWFFFLIKILWIFYGNLTRKQFYEKCKICLQKKNRALFNFFKLFEFWLPMFIYWAGFSQSFDLAYQWVKHGHVFVNNSKIINSFFQLKLFDYITFDQKIWKTITTSYTRILFYASWAAKRWRCYSVKYAQSKNWFSRAHFIGTFAFAYPDFWTFSLYWYKQPIPNNFKYYFSINISNVIKHLTL